MIETPDQQSIYDYVCENNTVAHSRLMRHDTYSQIEQFRVACEEASAELDIYLDEDEMDAAVDELTKNFLEY